MAIDRPITRSFIVPRSKDAAACSVEAIRAALAGADLELAVALVFARAKSRQPVEIGEIVPLAMRIDDLTLVEDLVAIARGDRAGLIEAVGRGPVSKESSARDVLLLFLAWRAGAERVRVIREARRLARAKLDGPGYVLLAEMAEKLADPNLTIATKHVAGLLTGKTKIVLDDLDKALARGVDAIVATFPETDETPRSANFTIRAAPRVGRNEPCPCGSGEKYKKCHGKTETAVAGSPVAGMSWDDFVTKGADKMSKDDIDKLELPDLARVDLAKLDKIPLVATFLAWSEEVYWDRASAAIDELGRRDVGDGDVRREELVATLLHRGELALARAQLDKVGTHDPVWFHELELDLREGRPGAYERLVATARAALESGEDIDFACMLVRAVPALGILVARGCMREGRLLDSETLAETIEDGRDELGLPPTDPAWDLLAILEERAGGDDEEGDGEDDDDEDREALRGSLAVTTSKIEQLERELAERKRELETGPATTIVAVEPEKIRALKAKIESLEGLVREGNTERTDLRRQLTVAARVQSAAAPAATTAASVDDEDALSDEVDIDDDRGIAIPTFERRVRDALDSVPAAVASDAMRTIGVLASGDGFAWSRVKQAKDMTRQVLMARIGIHHRLIFRVEDGVLSLLDLVTREDLLTTLKRMRANKT